MADFVNGVWFSFYWKQHNRLDSLKHLQRHINLMQLLTALLDVLQSRYHEIPERKTNKTV